MLTKDRLSQGFTIAELIIVIAVSGLLFGLLFGPLDDLYTANTNSLGRVVQTADIHGAQHLIADELRGAVSFASTLTASSPFGRDNDSTSWDWEGSDSDHRILITSNYATTKAENGDTTGSRSLVYSSSDCITPLQNNYVYFINDTTLYRRTIVNTSTTCNGATIAQKQSCASGVTNSNCKAIDAVIATGVSKFTISYCLNPSDTICEVSGGSTDPSNAQTIIVSITTTVASGTNPQSQTSKMRITRVNGATS